MVHVQQLLLRARAGLNLNNRTIATNDLSRGDKQRSRRGTDEHDDDEREVRARADGGELALTDVDRERDDRTDEGTELEDRPEDTEGLSFVFLEGVGHHDSTLGGPEEGSGETEDGRGEEEEPVVSGRLMAGSRVER